MRTSVAAAASTAFFLVPTTVSGVVPWLITRWSSPYDWFDPGLLPVRAAGLALLLLAAPTLVGAFARFVLEGFGTPMPAAPTERLVLSGPYRRVRNPMYVAVLAVIAGQALLLVRPVLLVYLAGIWGLFAIQVHAREEPRLCRTYGEEYDTYRAAVPAWLPRVRPWRGPGAERP